MPTVESRQVTVSAVKCAERGLAIQLDDGTRMVWVPARLVREVGPGKWQMPEWLALDRGLI
jgi:hypothetical protein